MDDSALATTLGNLTLEIRSSILRWTKVFYSGVNKASDRDKLIFIWISFFAQSKNYIGLGNRSRKLVGSGENTGV